MARIPILGSSPRWCLLSRRLLELFVPALPASIRESNGTQGGDGIAIAGLICSSVFIDYCGYYRVDRWV